MKFPVADCAFEGFRVTRRAPLAVLAWAGVCALFLAVFYLGAGPSLMSFVTLAQGLEGNSNPTPAEVEPLAIAYGGVLAWALPLVFVGGAIVSTAIARAVLRPTDARFGYLRVGKDEFRVLAVNLIVAGIMGLTSIVSFTLIGILAGLATVQPVLWLGVVLMFVAAVAALVWLAVRFSLAVPVTVAEGRVDLKAAFALTKGAIWPLFGTLIIAVLMSLVVTILGSVVAGPLTSLAGVTAGATPAETVQAMLGHPGAALAITVVVNAILTAAQISIIYAPLSAAYLHLKGANKVG